MHCSVLFSKFHRFATGVASPIDIRLWCCFLLLLIACLGILRQTNSRLLLLDGALFPSI